jgi:hypothetical protein
LNLSNPRRRRRDNSSRGIALKGLSLWVVTKECRIESPRPIVQPYSEGPANRHFAVYAHRRVNRSSSVYFHCR